MMGGKCRFSQSFRIPGETLENGAVVNEGNHHFRHHSWFCLSARISILFFSLLMPTILYSHLNSNQLPKGWLPINISSNLIPNHTAQVRRARTQSQLPFVSIKFICMHLINHREEIFGDTVSILCMCRHLSFSVLCTKLGNYHIELVLHSVR